MKLAGDSRDGCGGQVKRGSQECMTSKLDFKGLARLRKADGGWC